MNKTKISKTTTGNVGEHYVAAELERINFTTSVVGNNCKDYDIIAINNETHDDVLIQVKTSSNRNRWRVNQNNYNEDKLFYVLVSLKDDEPKYYILKSKEAVRLKEKHHKEFCKKHGYRFHDFKREHRRGYSEQRRNPGWRGACGRKDVTGTFIGWYA